MPVHEVLASERRPALVSFVAPSQFARPPPRGSSGAQRWTARFVARGRAGHVFGGGARGWRGITVRAGQRAARKWCQRLVWAVSRVRPQIFAPVLPHAYPRTGRFWSRGHTPGGGAPWRLPIDPPLGSVQLVLVAKSSPRIDATRWRQACCTTTTTNRAHLPKIWRAGAIQSTAGIRRSDGLDFRLAVDPNDFKIKPSVMMSILI